MRIKISNLNVRDELKEFVFVKVKRRSRVLFIGKYPKLSFSKNGIYNGVPVNKDMEEATETEYNTFINNPKNKKYKDVAQEASNYIYVFFIHLSKETMLFLDPKSADTKYTRIYKNKKLYTRDIRVSTSIDIENPLSVKKGQTIGFVGDSIENGGWAPHVHVETYLFSPYSSNKIYRLYKKGTRYSIDKNKINDAKTREEYLNKISRGANVAGTYARYNTKSKNFFPNPLEIILKSYTTFDIFQFLTRSAFDPNIIFDIYDEYTSVKKINY